jgi:site-specific DNA-methyltransferase (adenine-specific)
MKLMARYPDGYFDLAIVDPPYGQIQGMENKTNNGHFNLGSNGKGRFDKYFKPVEHVARRRTEKSTAYTWAKKYALNRTCTWDVAPGDDYFKELFRVSRFAVIWGGNYFADKLPPSRNFIVWDKLTISENFTMSMCEYAWTNIPGNAKRIEVAPQDKERFHPTQKPVTLYKKLLQWYSKPGYKILDTHLGAGGIAVACIDSGCDLIGCEIDPEYHDKAVKRVADYQKQKELFDAAELRRAQEERKTFFDRDGNE